MRRFALAGLASLGLALPALVGNPAAAGEYRVRGSFVDAETGEKSGVVGGLVLDEVEVEIDPRRVARPLVIPGSFVISDFAIAVADRILTPEPPLEFQGLRSLLLRIGNSLIRDGNDLLFFSLRAGGGPHTLSGDELTVRSFDFQSRKGKVRGKLRGSDFPARFSVVGELVEREQTYEMRTPPCPPRFPLPPPPPPPGGGGTGGGVIIGGGGVIIGGGGVIIGGGGVTLTDPFPNLDPSELLVAERLPTLEPIAPDAGGDVTLRSDVRVVDTLEGGYSGRTDVGSFVGSGGSSRFGRREFTEEAILTSPDLSPDVSTSERIAVNPQLATSLDAADTDAVLAQLGIAPSSVAVVDDGTGGITLTAPGDLVVAGGRLTFEGYSRIAIEVEGDLEVVGSLEFPEGVAVEIRTLGASDLRENVEIVIPPLEPRTAFFDPFCPGLIPRFPASERVLGTLKLEAVHGRAKERGESGAAGGRDRKPKPRGGR